jgi:O-antigen/teichoic acid export membrane protein
MKKLCIEYLDYPKKSAVGALLNAASYQVEFILFSVFYNLTNLGHYYFVNRIVSIPKVFISGSVWQVFLGENSRKSKTEILSSLSHYQQKMFIMTTLPFYSSLFIAPDLFIVIFGENWSVGGAYLYPLIIASHINLVVASFSLFTIINRPDIEMAFNALLAFFKIAAVIVTYLIVNNIFYSVVAVATVQFIMFLMLGGWNYRQLGKSNSYFPLLYCKQLINIAPKLIILFVVSYLTQSFPLMLVAVIVLNSIHLKSELL